VKWLGPDLGEHNDELFKGVLGMSDDELRRLAAEGVI
jgi:crotonobetainyl-CoA:carnitine CoA-transferase CaiB-like acyl-CoA transferase